MYKGKYKDLLLDGRWKIVGMTETATYTLENIYNHQTIKLSNRQVASVAKGEDTVSQIICRRIGGVGRIPIDNRTVKGYKRRIARYVK